ncbi:winged helix-turn-helix transcriptional regulator [Phyllobacterium ifriqiyense]
MCFAHCRRQTKPRRFSELRLDIPQVSAKVLSQRLRELEARDVINRTI